MLIDNKKIRARRKKDYIGIIFEIDDELGEFPYIAYGKLDKSSDKRIWYYLPHSRYDGIGGLVYLLQQHGYTIDNLPEIQENTHPSILTKFLLFLRQFRADRLQLVIDPIKWKQYDASKALQGAMSSICWYIFDKKETESIILAAKSNQITVNTFLLWTLNEATKQTLLQSSTKENAATWLMPVNMRGLIDLGDPYANHSISVRVEIAADNSVKKLHDNINEIIRIKKNYWAYWWRVQLMKFIGVNGMKRLMIKNQLPIRNIFGAFSNLGIWPPIKENTKEEDWLFSPPAFSTYPITAGCMTWYGKLSLTLQIHPVIANKEITQGCLDEWIRQIRNKCKI